MVICVVGVAMHGMALLFSSVRVGVGRLISLAAVLGMCVMLAQSVTDKVRKVRKAMQELEDN